MRKKLLAVILCASMLFPASVSAEVLGYEATLDTYTKEKKTPQQFQIDDGAGNTVNALAKSDTLYVTAKNTEIRSNPGDSGTELRSVILGTKLERVAVCDNGWSKVTFQKKGEDKIIGVTAKTVEQALKAQAHGADYLGVGAVFGTTSKADATKLDHKVLKEICETVDIPVVAIGGITEENVTALAGTGICGVAVISAVFGQPDIEQATKELKEKVEGMLK